MEYIQYTPLTISHMYGILHMEAQPCSFQHEAMSKKKEPSVNIAETPMHGYTKTRAPLNN